MSQGQHGVELATSLGYLVKQVASALRASMEDALRPLDMTVTRYSCLELLKQRPGLSNSELARGVFITRQSMNVLLQTLQAEGLVTRPDTAPVGRVLPVQLTASGHRQLEKATKAVRSVEDHMLHDLTKGERADIFSVLQKMVQSLGTTGAE